MIKKRRNQTIAIIIAMMLLCSNLVYADTEHFEKGDLLFRKGFMWYGHTAVYCGWDKIGDPEERENHIIVESDSSLLTYPEPGVISNNYFDFYNRGYKGAGTLNLYAEQRQKILDFVLSKKGYKYNFFEGYKDQVIGTRFYKTYRCDGLAEHSYEVARGNYGIVKDSDWNGILPYGLYPYKQQDSMGAALGIKPYIATLTVIPSGHKDSECYISKVVVVICDNVSDGIRGSGIAQVEFWAGDLSCTPDNITETGIKLGTDPQKVLIKGDYAYPWNTAAKNLEDEPEFPDGYYLIFAKAFDQAGNTKVSDGLEVIVNNIPPAIIDEGPTEPTSETKPTISATIVSEDGIVAVDLDSIKMTLDGRQVFPSVDSSENGCSIEVSYTPSDDLDDGQHTITIDAKDISGLAAEQKTWHLTITAITGGYWGDVLDLLNMKRSDVEKNPVIISHPEDIDMDGVLAIQTGTIDILEDYGFTGLADALNCAGYEYTTWSEGFDCKNEIGDILSLMHIGSCTYADLLIPSSVFRQRTRQNIGFGTCSGCGASCENCCYKLGPMTTETSFEYWWKRDLLHLEHPGGILCPEQDDCVAIADLPYHDNYIEQFTLKSVETYVIGEGHKFGKVVSEEDLFTYESSIEYEWTWRIVYACTGFPIASVHCPEPRSTTTPLTIVSSNWFKSMFPGSNGGFVNINLPANSRAKYRYSGALGNYNARFIYSYHTCK